MADPTRATVQTEWSNAIKILNQIRLFGNINATNLLSLINTLETAYAGDYIADASGAIQQVRALLAGSVSQDQAAAVQRAFLRTYVKSVIGRTDLTSDTAMWNELYRYMVDNSLRVSSRIMTYGAPSLTTGSGSVQMLRLSRDRYNFDMEGGYGDSKRARCLADQNTGTAQGNETWVIVGQARAKDELQRSGSGLEATIAGVTIDDSLVNNAGFRSFGGTAAAPTSLTSWTSSGGDSSSVYTLDSTNYYRVAPSDGSTSYALNIVASTNLTQKLTVRGTEVRDDTPYLMAVIWNRAVGSGSGTFNCRMGSITTTVSVSSQTGWNVTTVPSPVGFSCWYRQFRQADMQIGVEWIRTSGNLLVGEVLFVPGTFFDGTWYWILPSSAASWTAPVVRDEFTFADGESSSGGVNQRWFVRAGFGYLPHSNGSSITWADV